MPSLSLQGDNLTLPTCAVLVCWVAQLCLFCDPVDLPGLSVHGILQARIFEWAAMPSSRGSSRPKDWTRVSYVSCIGRWVLYYLGHLSNRLTKNFLFGWVLGKQTFTVYQMAVCLNKSTFNWEHIYRGKHHPYFRQHLMLFDEISVAWSKTFTRQ